MSEDLAKQAHYEALSPQPIEVIKAWDLDFFLGNVVKYIGRCKTKGQELEDLKKAKVYLQWKIDELQGKPEKVVPPKEWRKPGFYRRPHGEMLERRKAQGYVGYTRESWEELPEYVPPGSDLYWPLREARARDAYYEEVK